MTGHEYPILEFDKSKEALINPPYGHDPIQIAERCVPCFFG